MTNTRTQKRLLLLITGPFLALLFVACSGNTQEAQSTPQREAIPVETLVVEATTFTEYGEYYGTLKASEQAVLSAPGGGWVESILVSQGDRVSAGERLGAVDLENVLASYRVAELQERIARETFERQRELLRKGNASQLAVDQAELAMLSAEKQRIDAAQVLEGARCESPIDGTVVARHINLHDELLPGAPTFTVADTTEMRIEIGIPESEIAGVAPGNSARIRLDVYPDREWQGRLESLDRRVDPETLSFRGEVVIENSDGRLAPGQTALVVLERRNLSSSIVVPTEAIMSDGVESFVMLADQGIARRVAVVPGPADERRTVVTAGLSVLDTLITGGNHLVNDGSPIAARGQEG